MLLCSILSSLVLLLAARSAKACSVCRGGDDRFFLNGAQRLGNGSFILMGEYFSTSKTSALAGHEEQTDRGLGTALSSIQQQEVMFESHHQQVFRILFLYGLTERITVLGSLPYAQNRIEEEGATETSKGFADPEVIAIADLFETEEGDFELNATLGTRIPVGNGNQTDGSGQRLEQHLQAGTGAWGITAGVQAAHTMLAVPVFYGVSYQSNGSNSYDFSYGDVLRANVGTQVPVATGIRVLADLNLRYAAEDNQGSEVDPNSGGTVLYVSPGLRIALPAGLALRGQAQIPVVEDLFGVQDENVSFQIGLSIEP